MAEAQPLYPHEEPADYPNLLILDILEAKDYRMKLFVLHYVLGDEDVRGVAYKSYFAAGFPAKNNNSASASSSELMKNPLIKQAIIDLRDEMEREFKMRMKSWTGMAVKAQTILDRYLDTMLTPDTSAASGQAIALSTNQLIGISMVLDRALGKPMQKKEAEIGERLADAIKRLAKPRNVELPPVSAQKRLECVSEVFPDEKS